MAKLEIENAETRHSSDLFAQNLKTELEKVKTKINRLMDAYLEGDLELPEFQMKKNDLMSEKKTLEEKLSDPALCKRAGAIIGLNSQGIG